MLESLFNSAQQRAHEFPGASYQFQVCVFEIYNELVRDLLQPDDGAKEIKMDPESGVKYVSGGLKQDVSSLQQAWSIVERGISNRTVAATDMNSNSSRSHLIIMLDVVGHNPHLETAANFTKSRFCAVDLAGSERVAESGVQGLNLREASQINTSLSVLSRVINSLAQKSKIAPPYRESKLTWLLHDSLSGQSKSVMIVQVSPIESSISQTLQTLQFATRVKAIEISAGGQAKSVDVSRTMATLKKQYEEEIESLKISQLEKEAQLHEETSQLREQLDSALSQLEMSNNEILQLRAIIQQQQKQNDQLLATVRTMAPAPGLGMFGSDSPQRASLSVRDAEQENDSPNRIATVYKGTPLPAKRKSRSPAANSEAAAPQIRPFESTTPMKQIKLDPRQLTPARSNQVQQQQQPQQQQPQEPFQVHEDEDVDALLDSFTSDFQAEQFDDPDIDTYFDKENMWKAPASPLVPVRVVSRPTISCLKSCLMGRQAIQRPKKRVRWNEAELEEFSELQPKRAATTMAVQTGSTLARPQVATPRYQNALARRPVNVLPPSSPYRLGAAAKPKIIGTPVAPSLGAPARKAVLATPGKTPQKVGGGRTVTPGGLNKSKLVL
jgi:hypothetical protein